MRIEKILPILIFTFLLALTANGQDDYQQEIRIYSDSLYNSFDKLQKRIAVLSFADTARVKWNNLPVGMRPRAGLNIGNMTVSQRKLVHRVLSTSLSSRGYLKATSIMHLDDLINRYYDSLFYKKEINETIYQRVKGLLWTHKNYYFAFFAQSTDSIWGYKIEGHHLSLNFTFTGNNISVTPFFVGTDPAEYPNTEYAGWRVLGQEEDLGLKFINMHTPKKREKATMSTEVPADIIIGAESGMRLVDYWGITGKELTLLQKTILEYMIREFVFNLEYDKAVYNYPHC